MTLSLRAILDQSFLTFFENRGETAANFSQQLTVRNVIIATIFLKQCRLSQRV